MCFHRAHGVRSVSGHMVLIGRVGRWAGIDFGPFARTLPSRPLLCCTVLEHLVRSAVFWVCVDAIAHLLGNDVEFALNPVLMRHAEGLDVGLGPHAHALS
jgi:hypothetical protein